MVLYEIIGELLGCFRRIFGFCLCRGIMGAYTFGVLVLVLLFFVIFLVILFVCRGLFRYFFSYFYRSSLDSLRSLKFMLDSSFFDESSARFEKEFDN